MSQVKGPFPWCPLAVSRRTRQKDVHSAARKTQGEYWLLGVAACRIGSCKGLENQLDKQLLAPHSFGKKVAGEGEAKRDALPLADGTEAVDGCHSRVLISFCPVAGNIPLF